ncbi:unnamed protein product, partial [Clonostachys rhizophaga]
FNKRLNETDIGFHRLLDIGSDTYFDLLRHWLNSCDNSEDHRYWGCHRGSNSVLPSRVLDVGEGPNSTVLRLYCSQPNEQADYIALSHCWGNLPPKYLNQVRTLKSNIAKRVDQIDMGDLPQNFRDAITVTRQLNKRYLWIDSLCIIQDDPSDWEREAKKMETVYTMAYCTLAASSAQDSTVGFLEPRPSRRYFAINRTGEMPYYVCEPIDNFNRDVESSALNSRGWVFQERCLSKRTIHFTNTQTYWECGIGVHCETLTLMYKLGDPAFPSTIGYGVHASEWDFVKLLIQKYTQLNLTKPEDRALAFLGIEQRFEKELCTDIKHGLAEKFLHRGLLWQRAGNSPLKRIKYPNDRNIPSWSWMAWNGEITFLGIYRQAVFWNESLLFPSKGKLYVRLRMFRSSIEERRKWTSAESLDGSDNTKRNWIRLDRVDDDLLSARCAILGIEKNQGDSLIPLDHCYVLIVQPAASQDENHSRYYERIGVGFIHKKELSIDENVITGWLI